MDLLIIKIVVSTLIVIGLSLIVEYAGPKTAGILSGYPLGAAIVLFFFGIENGVDFAASSALFALVGLIASQAFVFFYYKISEHSRQYVVIKSSLTALFGYLLVVLILRNIELNLTLSILCPIVSIFVFIYLFRRIENRKLSTKVSLTPKIIFLRAILSTSIVLGITALPQLIGPTWSGLFSSFPITLFPLILIVHLTYSKEHVHTIIKNFPLGLGSLIIYCLSVAGFYPHCGLYLGTFVSFLMATGYLACYYLLMLKIQKSKTVR